MKTLILLKMAGKIVAAAIALLSLGYVLFEPARGASKHAVSQEYLAGAKQRNATRRARFQAFFSEVGALENQGDLRAAQAKYEVALKDHEMGMGVRKPYARLLEKLGKYQEALAMVKPFIFRGSIMRNGTLITSSDFEAVDIYDRNVLKAEGKAAQNAFRNSIRDSALNGFSLRHYNQEGLTDDEAMDYIRGSYAGGRGDDAEALRQFEKILPHHPPSFMFYASIKEELGALHRQKEIIPLFEDWYRHSSPEMKAQIKKRCFLDYSRLDAEGTP